MWLIKLSLRDMCLTLQTFTCLEDSPKFIIHNLQSPFFGEGIWPLLCVNAMENVNRPVLKSRLDHILYCRIYFRMGQCKMQSADWLQTIVFTVRKQWDYFCRVLICMVKTIVCILHWLHSFWLSFAYSWTSMCDGHPYWVRDLLP